jgi:hypothetical protein
VFANALSKSANGCVLHFCSTVRVLTQRLTNSLCAALPEHLAQMRSHSSSDERGSVFVAQREKENVMDVRTLALPPAGQACSHLLRFASLYDPGRALAVPCNEAGVVDMDSLSQRLRITYLGARALVGREYACPTVQCAG